MFGFELPVAWSGPGGHGPGAEVGVLSGLRGQLQAHGGDVRLSNWNDVAAPSEGIQSLIPWYQTRLDTFIELHKYNSQSFLFAEDHIKHIFQTEATGSRFSERTLNVCCDPPSLPSFS